MTETIVLATNNSGKIQEFQTLLKPLSIKLVSQQHYQVSDVAETGLTFVENAIIKARHAAQQTELPALADDSGLEVDALQGAPGIYSARFAGIGASAKDNNNKLLDCLAGLPKAKRRARFHCVLVYFKHASDPTPLICQAQWEGIILSSPQGQQGHGYDPIFYVPEKKCSAAELTLDEKNKLSHRGKAIVQFIKHFRALTACQKERR